MTNHFTSNVRRSLLFYTLCKMYGDKEKKKEIVRNLLGDEFDKNNPRLMDACVAENDRFIGERTVYSLAYVFRHATTTTTTTTTKALSRAVRFFRRLSEQRVRRLEKVHNNNDDEQEESIDDRRELSIVFVVLSVMLHAAIGDERGDDVFDFLTYRTMWNNCLKDEASSSSPCYELMITYLFSDISETESLIRRSGLSFDVPLVPTAERRQQDEQEFSVSNRIVKCLIGERSLDDSDGTRWKEYYEDFEEILSALFVD